MEISQPGHEMSISLPCRERLRMPEPDVLILYSPKHDQILIKNNSSLNTAHLVVDKPALAFHLQLSLGFLEHFSSFGRKRPSCFCTVSALHAGGTLHIWVPAKQRLPASSGTAYMPIPLSKAQTSFLHCHLHSLLKSCLLILAHFSKWLHFNSTLSTDDPQSHILSQGSSPQWLGQVQGLGILLSTPCLFSL